MGKGGKKKKKGGVAEAGVAMEDRERHAYLSLQVETLERELQVKAALSEEALRSETELRSKVDQMEDDFKEEQSTTFAVTADMARQYKALQEELIYKINSLETQLTEQKEELDITDHELRELIRNKNDDIEYKDEQIRQLNERMNEMSHEFANMLQETLELMKTHIEEKLADGGADQDAGGEAFAKRLQDYSTKAYNAVSVTSRPNATSSTGGGTALMDKQASASGTAALEAAAA
eukprot:TRINITY_DN13225_c1_g1_i1.p1 TRINITY_DN13225_c1_g1~~TRINITY_DN13225_c1_g1_i1.p1  ORF type:complete len:266 (+),score=87.57 TRINITY_DN13225_c1_g1_i1:95-799(+)